MNQDLNPTGVPVYEDEDEISLLDLGTTLGEEKKLIFGLPFLAGIVAIVVSLLLPPVFTARTTLLTPQGSGGAAAALASLSGLSGLPGVGAGGGVADNVMNILQSRSVKDEIISRFDLRRRYAVESKQDTYKRIDEVVRIGGDKKAGLITIEVDDKDPQIAAEMANAYYDALRKVMTRVAVTEAQQRRVFFEEQFAKAKEDLSNAEVALKETQERTGLVELKSQAEATIGAVARLRAEIAQREVQLSAMRTFATAENADYRRVVAELNGLRTELKKLDKGGTGGELGLVSAGNLPEQGLEYVRAFREVKYNEAIFEIMAKQFELAKIDEAKDGGDVQQLDAAVPPERKSKPKRAMIVVVSVLAAGFLAVLIALLKGALRNGKQNPETREKLSAFKRAWGIKG